MHINAMSMGDSFASMSTRLGIRIEGLSSNDKVVLFETKLLEQAGRIHLKMIPAFYKPKDAQEAVHFLEYFILYEGTKLTSSFDTRSEKLFYKTFIALEEIHSFTQRDGKIQKKIYLSKIKRVINKVQKIYDDEISPIDQLALKKYVEKSIKILKGYEKKLN